MSREAMSFGKRFEASSEPHTLRWPAHVAAAATISLFSAFAGAAQSPEAQGAQQQGSGAAQPGTDSRPVISRDTIPQGPSRTGSPGQGPASPNRLSVPEGFTIPAGTVIFVRVNEPLSSDRNHPGDGFTATLDRPIIVDGWVVARRGQTILGSVTEAQKAGRVKGVSELGLELTDITVASGQQLPVLTELWKSSAGTSRGADAAGIATTTGVGTIIGAAADGGAGAGIGAGAGAVAGMAMVLLTRGKPTVLGPETLLSFRLQDPVDISTANSQHAFQPVGPYDYGSSPSLRPRAPGYAAYPPAYPPAYYTTCGLWGCAPYYGPSIGVTYYSGYHGAFGRWVVRR